MDPSFFRLYRCDITDPDLVRRRDFKAALDQVGRWRLHTFHRVHCSEALDTRRLNVLQLAQSPDAMFATLDAFGAQQMPHLDCARGPTMRCIDSDDVGTNGQVFL